MNAPANLTIDHGEAMDRMYRWQRHIYDASRRFYLLGRNEMLQGLAAKPGQSILEIGCGTGRNLALAAKLYPSAQLFGFDISNEMLKTAKANLKSAGVEQNVRLAQGDATDFDCGFTFQRKSFDRVYFSYTLSMVPQWQEAIAHALTMLGDNGELHIVDFGQCEKWPKMFKHAIFRWLEMFDVTPRQEMQNVRAAYAKQQKLNLTFEKTYRGYVWCAVLRRV